MQNKRLCALITNSKIFQSIWQRLPVYLHVGALQRMIFSVFVRSDRGRPPDHQLNSASWCNCPSDDTRDSIYTTDPIGSDHLYCLPIGKCSHVTRRIFCLQRGKSSTLNLTSKWVRFWLRRPGQVFNFTWIYSRIIEQGGEQGSWEADRQSGGQDIPYTIRNQKIHYRAQNSRPPVCYNQVIINFNINNYHDHFLFYFSIYNHYT